DQEELIHLISNYSKISLYQHHLTKSQNKKQKEAVTKVLSQPLILNKRCSPANSSVTSHNIHKT
ncbi:hypothetical protein, partial [Enterococcus faecium]|uniref:hypothetical protein n=1 Tax=Enterococcus faecium TaxID=1352 RepID=UPI0019D6BF8F